MIIVLEGQNGVGKTTLAEKLVKRFKMAYNKYPGHTRDVKSGYEYYMKLAYAAADNTIQDRFHIGECVYPLIKMDGRIPLAVWQQHQVERLLANRGGLIIRCVASKEFIQRAYIERGEEYLHYDDVPLEEALFNEACSHCIMPIVTYNPEMRKDEEAAWFKELESIMKILENQRIALSKFKSTGISIDPTALLADKHKAMRKLHKLHKVMIVIGGQRLVNDEHISWLHQSLAKTSAPEEFYITPSAKASGFITDSNSMHLEMIAIEPKVVIAIGNAANEHLTKYKIRHYTIPGLFSIKRLWWKRIAWYAGLIQTCINHHRNDKIKLPKEIKCI